jgi:hypothetical protein
MEKGQGSNWGCSAKEKKLKKPTPECEVLRLKGLHDSRPRVGHI